MFRVPVCSTWSSRNRLARPDLSLPLTARNTRIPRSASERLGPKGHGAFAWSVTAFFIVRIVWRSRAAKSPGCPLTPSGTDSERCLDRFQDDTFLLQRDSVVCRT
jgi:hypothetical protein